MIVVLKRHSHFGQDLQRGNNSLLGNNLKNPGFSPGA